MKTLTRLDLQDSLMKLGFLSRMEATRMVDSVLSEASNGIARQRVLKIAGFGTFFLRDKKERIGRNPKTGKEVMITPRQSISFRSSILLKKIILKRAEA